MKENLLIVEDEFIVANDLKIMLTKAGYQVCGIAASVQEAKQMVERLKPTWVLLDIFLQEGSMGTDIAGYLSQKNIGFIYVSANTNESVLEKAKATRPYGFLVKPFRERDLLTMLDIAREKHRHHLQTTAQREVMLQQQLGLLNASSVPKADKLRQLSGLLQPMVPFDVLELSYPDDDPLQDTCYYFIRTGFNEYQLLNTPELHHAMNLGRQDIAAFQRAYNQPDDGCYNGPLFKAVGYKRWQILAHNYRLSSCLTVSFSLPRAGTVRITFFSRSTDSYTAAQQITLQKAEKQFAGFVMQLYHETNTPIKTTQPVITKVQPNKKLDNTKFEQIIGKSHSLVKVLDQISMVAGSNISVLITGESGTGKERVAKSIHELSARKGKPMITVNCAALPFELIESELFGHEKGSFTGATDKRTGKFEAANGGTIFLDEVGELPLDAQVKLLRVLQEKEIEHVGGSKTISIDVRVIAATNRKLEKEIAEGRFRLDLYYRLNVFPIELPPLRQRKDDISALAEHFAQKYGEEFGKPVSGLSKNAVKILLSYHWPGNIRELEHLIQRSVITAIPGGLIDQIEIPELHPQINNTAAPAFQLKTLEESEADHILGVLKHCGGKVCGPGGAAEILGLPPSTLNSKIKKLGIKRDDYFTRQ